MSTESCFHCGEPIPPDCHYRGEFEHSEVAFCCPACQSVFELINKGGLSRYYRSRDDVSSTPVPQAQYEAFDLEAVQQGFTEYRDGQRESRLLVEGIHCSSCTWLLERYLSHLDGVVSVSVQLQNQQARIIWDPAVIKLSTLFQAIADLGYGPSPYRPNSRDELVRKTRRAYLGRLGVAGIGAMQVGMFAIALYSGEAQSMDVHWRDLLRYFSLLIATAVVFYSAQPFYSGAWRSLRLGVAGMDVPVALAIGLAYGFSVWATLTGGGQVYFDSVSMFTFFLLASRYLEFQARSNQWFFPRDLFPETAYRYTESGLEQVPLDRLSVGDRIQVAAGQTIPADGIVVAGEGAVNEAAFTGEFMPERKTSGGRVLAGSVNGDTPLDIEVCARRDDAVLDKLEQLADRAMNEKPRITQLADSLSHYFVLAVLVIFGATALYWWRVDADRALWVALSVLVVSCPCALSLATPSAIASALRQLQRGGVLVTRSAVLETLPQCRSVVFDKTGTLTCGKAALQKIQLTADVGEDRCLAIAAALEARSVHPLAAAFNGVSRGYNACDVRYVSGAGVEGRVDGQLYRLGSKAFCQQLVGRELALPDAELRWIALCGEGQLLAWIAIHDPLRGDALDTVSLLQAQGLDVHLLSGDASGHVVLTAQRLGIENWQAGASAQDKLAYVQALQQAGPVLVVGDGVNDLPILAAADVSVAMSEASDLSKARADCILLSPRLKVLVTLLDTARRSQRLIRQNIAWALLYNGFAVPLAALGFVPPYLAAIGMSLSSLLVVGNSLRLQRERKTETETRHWVLGEADG